MRRRAVAALWPLLALSAPALLLGPAAWAQAAAADEPRLAEMVDALRPRVVRAEAAGSAAATATAAASAGATTGASAATAEAPTASVPRTPSAPAPSLWLPVQFQADSAQVRPGSGPLLGALVAAMQTPELKDSRFLVEGHAERGSAAARARLALERADQVRLYLVALGVHPSRLRAVAASAAAPPARGEGARRVRIVTQE